MAAAVKFAEGDHMMRIICAARNESLYAVFLIGREKMHVKRGSFLRARQRIFLETAADQHKILSCSTAGVTLLQALTQSTNTCTA